MKTKAEVRQNVINFIKMIKTHFNYNVKIPRSDNGLEFIMPEFYSS
jgi:hypothetical protein